MMSLLTGCSANQKRNDIPNEPIVINKVTYVLPPDYLLKECAGNPVDNKIQTVILTQKQIIDDCNVQIELLRRWTEDKKKEQK